MFKSFIALSFLVACVGCTPKEVQHTRLAYLCKDRGGVSGCATPQRYVNLWCLDGTFISHNTLANTVVPEEHLQKAVDDARTCMGLK